MDMMKLTLKAGEAVSDLDTFAFGKVEPRPWESSVDVVAMVFPVGYNIAAPYRDSCIGGGRCGTRDG